MLTATALIATLAVSLGSATPNATSRGRRLFSDPGLGNNGVACVECHSTVENEAAQGDGRLRAGHSLWGVAKRSHWRGDARRTAFRSLGKAVDVCVQLFQGGAPLDKQDRRWIVAYLKSLKAKRSQPALQIVPALEANLDYDRPKYRSGDPDRGRALFYRACNGCHPKAQQGLGPTIAATDTAEIALKIREGNGLLRGSRQAGAWMPFYGRDRLSDQNVADIAAFVSTVPRDEE